MHAAKLNDSSNQVSKLYRFLRSVGGGRVRMSKIQGWATTGGIAIAIGSFAPSTVMSALRQQLAGRHIIEGAKREWIEVSKRGTNMWWYRLQRKGANDE